MSRIGNRPIKISDGVTVSKENGSVVVKSNKGSLNYSIVRGIDISINEGVVQVTRDEDSKKLRSLHGLTARIIRNMINDTANGYSKILEFKGTGYRAKSEGDTVFLNMGFSHEITIKIPEGITVLVVKNKITISGIDRAKIGQLSAVIRKVRPPEVYKGKGIKYDFETIKKKAGKAAQSSSGKA